MFVLVNFGGKDILYPHINQETLCLDILIYIYFIMTTDPSG